jgi:hypothetical protein
MSKFQQNQGKAPTIFGKPQDAETVKNIAQKFSPENMKKIDEDIDKTTSVKVNKNLEDLIFLGKIEKTINISSFKFKISTLNNNEQKKLILFINSYDDREKVFSLKLATLALSIKEINDTPFVSFIGLDSDSLEEKVNFLEQLQSNLLDTLFNSYAELSKESSDIVSVQEIKN